MLLACPCYLQLLLLLLPHQPAYLLPVAATVTLVSNSVLLNRSSEPETSTRALLRACGTTKGTCACLCVQCVQQ